MSNISKGNYYELKVKKWLESEGWLVEKAKRTRFNSIDFFGLFDLIAIKKGLVFFIQVKARKISKKSLEKIIKFAGEYRVYWFVFDECKNKKVFTEAKKVFVEKTNKMIKYRGERI